MPSGKVIFGSSQFAFPLMHLVNPKKCISIPCCLSDTPNFWMSLYLTGKFISFFSYLISLKIRLMPLYSDKAPPKQRERGPKDIKVFQIA